MKKKFLCLSALAAVGFLFNGAVADERHPDMPNGMKKCYPGSPECQNKIESVYSNGQGMTAKKLKMDSIEKFQGTVQNVKREQYPDGRMFISIVLETSEGDMKILVGPASYVDQSKVKLQIGDKVTVKGYRVGANGDEMIMAQEIDKSGNILKLRDDQRQPMWGNGNSNGNGNSYRHNGRH